MKLFSRHRLPINFTIDYIIWVSSEKGACSLMFSYVEAEMEKRADGADASVLFFLLGCANFLAVYVQIR